MTGDEKGKSIKDVILTLFYTVSICVVGYGIFFFAEEKYNIKRTYQAMDVISVNMHASFDKDNIYPQAVFIQTFPITPERMVVPDAAEYFWKHDFGGSMLIAGSDRSFKYDSDTYYNVILNSLSHRQCKLLASYDWRENPSFIGVTAFGYSILAKSAGVDFKNITRLMTEKEAAAKCDCEKEPYCSVVLVYR